MNNIQERKICYILSYRAPDYIRTRTLLNSLKNIKGLKVYTAINTRPGFTRYLETLIKLIQVRIKENPDYYILGFRGTEIFFPVRLLTLGKPLIFDSFVSPSVSLIYDKKLGTAGFIIGKFMKTIERLMLKYSELILSDTHESAKFQSRLFNININKFKIIYVGTDEKEFKETKTSSKDDGFEVFTYATFLPLHGVDIILDAAILLRSYPVHFTIAGGAGKDRKLSDFQKRISENGLKNVTHYSWIEFDILKEYINKASLCLGGPFGNTTQSNLVITGKTFQFLASAKPTVVGINKEILRCGFIDRENCLTVKQGDAQALADAILWTYQNQSKLGKIAFRGRKLYERTFSDSEITKNLKLIINSFT